MPRKSPSAGEIADQLSQVVSALRRKVRAAAGEEALAYPLHLMLKRLEVEGPATTADLARAEAIKPQTAGVLIASLEAAALVARKDDAQDGRQRLVHLTAKGRKLIAARRARSHGWLAEQIAARLDADEMRLLGAATAVLRKLVQKETP